MNESRSTEGDRKSMITGQEDKQQLLMKVNVKEIALRA